MSHWSAQLARIADKPSRQILGLMSGTSLDGLDMVLCNIQGTGKQTSVNVTHSMTRPYSAEWQSKLRSVFAQRRVDLEDLSLLNEELGTLHGTWVKDALMQWQVPSSSVDCVASHGQTVFHSPQHFHQQAGRPHASLQIGDGDHVAAACGIITLCDFRQRHLAAGGEGAPLVLYGDELLFASALKTRVLINLGGIANLTLLPKAKDQPAMATDCGPANTLMDSYCQRYLARPFDLNGEMASKGKVHQSLLDALLAHSFFSQALPKTTGPELFSMEYLDEAMRSSRCEYLNPNDVMATLLQLTVTIVVDVLQQLTRSTNIDEVYISGGGASNPTLMTAFDTAVRHRLLAQLKPFEQLGISADDKEAALFAVLANECIAGENATGDRFGSAPRVRMGKICFPD